MLFMWPLFLRPYPEPLMAFGYTDLAWAALTVFQRNTAVFAQLDANLVFAGNSTKAALFAEAATYLLVHRPEQDSTGSRASTYANLQALLDQANKIVSASVSVQNGSSFTRGKMLI